MDCAVGRVCISAVRRRARLQSRSPSLFRLDHQQVHLFAFPLPLVAASLLLPFRQVRWLEFHLCCFAAGSIGIGIIFFSSVFDF